MSEGKKNALEEGNADRAFVERIRVRTRTFKFPLVRDAAVLGISAPLEPGVVKEAISQASTEPFVEVEIDDAEIKSVLVRKNLLAKTGWPLIADLVCRQAKPWLAESEILALELEIEFVVAQNLMHGGLARGILASRGQNRAGTGREEAPFKWSTILYQLRSGRSAPPSKNYHSAMARILKTSPRTDQTEEEAPQSEQYVRARIRALEIPPVKDGIVIGRSAPMGADAMMRTLKLMSTEHFVHLSVSRDKTVSDIIVRESVLRKLKEEPLRAFVMRRIKPLMAENELLLLDMEIEVVVEDSL